MRRNGLGAVKRETWVSVNTSYCSGATTTAMTARGDPEDGTGTAGGGVRAFVGGAGPATRIGAHLDERHRTALLDMRMHGAVRAADEGRVEALRRPRHGGGAVQQVRNLVRIQRPRKDAGDGARG